MFGSDSGRDRGVDRNGSSSTPSSAKKAAAAVIEVLDDPLAAAEFGDTVLAAQASQHNADLLYSGMMPACGSANIPDFFSALSGTRLLACLTTGLR